jgi:hypothetical protein
LEGRRKRVLYPAQGLVCPAPAAKGSGSSLPSLEAYRGTSLVRNRHPVGPYSRNMPRALRRSQEGGLSLMSEVSLYGKGLARQPHPPGATQRAAVSRASMGRP